MEKYEMIFEALQNKLSNGEITFEEAESLNNAAYEKYVVEGNAFNRVVKDKEKKAQKLDNKANAYENLSKSTTGKVE